MEIIKLDLNMGYKTIFGIMVAYSVVCALIWLPYIATMKIGSGLGRLKQMAFQTKSKPAKRKKTIKKTKKRLNNIKKKPTLSSRLKYFFRGTLMILKNADDNELTTLSGRCSQNSETSEGNCYLKFLY